MTYLEIILFIYLGIVFVGTFIQTIIEFRPRTISDLFFTLFGGLPLLLIINIFMMPFVGVSFFSKYLANPKPECFVILHVDENNIDEQLFALGFEKADNMVSVDNIPYSGYVYRRNRMVQIIIANDYEFSNAKIENHEPLKRRYLRVSIYEKNDKTKFIKERLEELKEHYKDLVNAPGAKEASE